MSDPLDPNAERREQITRDALKAITDAVAYYGLTEADASMIAENIVMAVAIALGRIHGKPWTLYADAILERLPQKREEVAAAVRRAQN